MDAIDVVNRREFLQTNLLQEIVIWRVPLPLRGSVHHFKYRLALVADGVCVLGYDNEAGKADHRHIGTIESQYVFSGVRALFQDFDTEVARWIDDNRGD